MDCIIYKATVKYFTGNIKNQKTIFELKILFIFNSTPSTGQPRQSLEQKRENNHKATIE